MSWKSGENGLENNLLRKMQIGKKELGKIVHANFRQRKELKYDFFECRAVYIIGKHSNVPFGNLNSLVLLRCGIYK